MTKPIAEYQYLLTCPECGGGISMYSEKILTKAQLLQIEVTLPAACVLCNMMRQVTMKGGKQ
jgi:hypothetical protein